MSARLPLKCPELSRLPKAKALKSINFARQTPGTVSQLLSPRPSENVVDPTHPAAAGLSRFLFPSVKLDCVMVKAYPMAILEKPELEYTGPLKRTVESWESRVQRMTQSAASSATPSATTELDERNTRMRAMAVLKKRRNDSPETGSMLPLMELNNERKGRVSMSFIHVSRVTRLGKINRCTRVRVIRKLKTAINYIVVRGASVETSSDGKKEIVFANDPSSIEESKWILRGWTYMFFPSIEVYRMPYQDLIPTMRKALKEIWEKGTRLESKWEKSLLLQQKSTHSRREGKHEATSSNAKIAERIVEKPVPDARTKKLFRTSPLIRSNASSNTNPNSPPASKKVPSMPRDPAGTVINSNQSPQLQSSTPRPHHHKTQTKPNQGKNHDPDHNHHNSKRRTSSSKVKTQSQDQIPPNTTTLGQSES